MDKKSIIEEIEQLHKDKIKAVYAQEFEKAIDIWNKERALRRKLKDDIKVNVKHSR